MALLDISNLKKVYGSRGSLKKVQALDDVTFSVEPGEFVAIMGESGSGKTTLLNLLAALDRPTSGKILLEGKDISSMKDRQLADFRRDELGFVFQDFHLLDTFNVQDNIYLPMVLAGRRPNEMHRRLAPIARLLGLENLLHKYPFELSGGQKQRVAVARALMNDPRLILADEPTGALDSRSAEELLDLFEQINEQEQTILMVTHSIKAASRASRVLFIKDGKIFHQLYRAGQDSEQFYQKISEALIALGESA